MILTTLLLAATPFITTGVSDGPPEPIRRADVETTLLIAGDVLCDAYQPLRAEAPLEMLFVPDEMSYSALDSLTIVMYETVFEGRLTDAGRAYLIDWLDDC